MKRIHKGSKFAFYNRTYRPERQLLLWAANLKPGDVIGACTGFNHYVKDVKIHWCKVGNKTKFVNEVEITDTLDRLHFTPGCFWKPYTIDEIKKFFIDNIECWEEQGYDKDGRTRKLVERFKKDLPVVDEQGVLLPDIV